MNLNLATILTATTLSPLVAPPDMAIPIIRMRYLYHHEPQTNCCRHGIGITVTMRLCLVIAMSGDGAGRSGLVKANCRPNGSECLSEAVAYGDLEMDVSAERREAQRERERCR